MEKEISSTIISFYPKKVKEDINNNDFSKYELISNISYDDVEAKEVIHFLENNPISLKNI